MGFDDINKYTLGHFNSIKEKLKILLKSRYFKRIL